MVKHFILKLAYLIVGAVLIPNAFSLGVKQKDGEFGARVAKLNTHAELIRLKANFSNFKYLNKKDRLVFWDERGPEFKCKGIVLGKSPDYILIKVPQLKYCQKNIFIRQGVYLKFFSEDLMNNLMMGHELMSILLKKRLALRGRLIQSQKKIDIHIEKVNAVNARYKVLRDKLEAEWRDQIGSLEEDRVTHLRNYKSIEKRVLDIDHKVEKYRVENQNMKVDRWSLDSKLYYKK